MKLNFANLPKEIPSNDESVQKGFHDLTIKMISKTVATTGAKMLAFELSVTDKFSITKNVVYEKADGTANQFGLYELGAIMSACNVIPEGDFSIDIIPVLLQNKRFRGELVDHVYNGKTYLQLGKAETFGPIVATANQNPAQVSNDIKKELEENSAILVNDEI